MFLKCPEKIMKRNKKSIFPKRYLRAVGQRWVCPADSLPCFFKLTRLMKAEMPETQLSSVESPMQGNNWRPAHPDGGERPTFFFLFFLHGTSIGAGQQLPLTFRGFAKAGHRSTNVELTTKDN